MAATHEENDIFRECLTGIEECPDLDASFIFDEAEKLLKQAVSLHRRTFAKSRTEIFRCETELKKVSKERDSLKILYVKKEGEIIDLRVELTKACQERSKFIKKFHQKGESVLQLLEDPKMKEAETLGWRQGMDNLVSEKETLRE
uniref:Uncharacterized protein isoform X2 n=1 Tax=Nicotiana tabacum TaxID=4097 RepID=A0A1S3WY88_TOBAC|nr:PREDICTED: uncharacterized protein LOC107759281 isoform X2 [Nicotiana tabacum]